MQDRGCCVAVEIMTLGDERVEKILQCCSNLVMLQGKRFYAVIVLSQTFNDGGSSRGRLMDQQTWEVKKQET